jgi:hypothetical protein
MKIVPPGTPGAIPLKEALEIKMVELRIPHHSGEHHSKAMKRAWAEGKFDDRARASRPLIRNRGVRLGRVA